MSDTLRPDTAGGDAVEPEEQSVTSAADGVMSDSTREDRGGAVPDGTSELEAGEAMGTTGHGGAAAESAEASTGGEPGSADEGVATGESGDGGDRAPGAGGRSGRLRQLEREGEVAADFLETLLDIADLDGDLDVDVDGDRAAVAIVDSEEGRVPRRLVGPDGKVLDALQELTRLAVQAETGERSRLMLDIAGYRAERRKTLVELAKRAIAEVKETGTKRQLEPMSAFERKVVHDVVADEGLVSESEGAEPRRFIVIHPG